jgi:hypothetical protein
MRTRADSRYPLRKLTNTRIALALVAALVAAAVSVSAAGSSTPIKRSVLVVVKGQGKVTSLPGGITCPRTCRNFFPKDSRVRLVAHPAAGWKVGRWTGQCTGAAVRCAFYLTTDHECSAQLCATGAFGVKIAFVRRPATAPLN